MAFELQGSPKGAGRKLAGGHHGSNYQREGNGLGSEKIDRKMFGRISVAYLAEHLDIPEGPVRLDVVDMLIVGESKALLRHHINALGVAGSDLD